MTSTGDRVASLASDSDRPREIRYTLQTRSQVFPTASKWREPYRWTPLLSPGRRFARLDSASDSRPLPVVQHCRGEQVARWLPVQRHPSQTLVGGLAVHVSRIYGEVCAVSRSWTAGVSV